MFIRIAERLAPFSHEPGVVCPVPGTHSSVRVFPTRVEWLQGGSVEEVCTLPLSGPFREFTTLLDLEKGLVLVFGWAQEGYFRYSLRGGKGGIEATIEKGPPTLRPFVFKDSGVDWKKQGEERLSFGCHRKQEVHPMRQRGDSGEILPFLHALGAWIPPALLPVKKEGTLLLLEPCSKAIEAKDRRGVGRALLNLFQAGFEGLFSPRLADHSYLGLIPPLPSTPSDINPFVLIQEGAKLIRSLVFQEKGDCWALLPCLPVTLHSGRVVALRTKEGDVLSLEWSKKLLKKVRIAPAKSRQVLLELQPELTSFRLRSGRRSRGVSHNAGEPLILEKGHEYFLDRFQK